ncbi:hypothetical protein, partial [Bacillus sp. SRB_8]|uniref:hypothetical protein n=1 Tax=Bacillus sp. SRB_8 TaxID=1969377 RepID=UPI000DC60C7B
CPKCGATGSLQPQKTAYDIVLRCTAAPMGVPCRKKLGERQSLQLARTAGNKKAIDAIIAARHDVDQGEKSQTRSPTVTQVPVQVPEVDPNPSAGDDAASDDDESLSDPAKLVAMVQAIRSYTDYNTKYLSNLVSDLVIFADRLKSLESEREERQQESRTVSQSLDAIMAKLETLEDGLAAIKEKSRLGESNTYSSMVQRSPAFHGSAPPTAPTTAGPGPAT